MKIFLILLSLVFVVGGVVAVNMLRAEPLPESKVVQIEDTEPPVIERTIDEELIFRDDEIVQAEIEREDIEETTIQIEGVEATPLKPLKPLSSQVNNPRTRAVKESQSQPLNYTGPMYLQPIGTYKKKGIKSEKWMPSHRLIKCRLVNSIQSDLPQSPVIALVTEDIIHHGEIVIPKGTEIHGRVSGGRTGNRVSTANNWKIVLGPKEGKRNGYETTVSAQVLFRDEARNDEVIAQEDGTAGFLGVVKERNPDELKQLMVLTGLQGGLQALKDRTVTDNGSQVSNVNAENAAIEAVSAPLETWIERRLNRIGDDPYYVEVRGGTAFYLYTLSAMDLSYAEKGKIAQSN